MKRIIIIATVIVLSAAVAYVTLGGTLRTALAEGAAPAAAPELAPVRASNDVIAEGRVLPVQHADLSPAATGIVAEVAVDEGEAVEAGEVLLRLQARREEAALIEAQAGLAAAEARLAQALAGPSDEQIAVAEAGVAVARNALLGAQGSMQSAQASLSRVESGATPEEVAIAERRVEQAKNALWNAQGQRDGVCGRVGRGALQGDCDAASANVQRLEEEVRIAELQLTQVRDGARDEDIAMARAGVQEAAGRLAVSEAQVREAEARLAQALAGPSEEEIAVSQAQVLQAQAAVARAEAALADTEVRAPFSGTVAGLYARVGEQVTPGQPVLRLADLAAWRIETDDLTELQVVRLAEGAESVVTFDALSDVELPGMVTRVRPIGENKRGDMTYTVEVTLAEQDPRLRWNMTAVVRIAAQP